MGKTRDLFKNIRDTKGIFHAKMGPIMDRTGIDLTKAEDIKNGKNTKKNYTKRILMMQITTMVITMVNHNGVIAHLELDILEYKVKQALGSITMNKASGGDGIPVELFQTLK